MPTFLSNLTASGGLLRVRAGIALTLTGAIAYLFISGEHVPADLQKLWILSTTLYFAPRIGADATKTAAPPPPPDATPDALEPSG